MKIYFATVGRYDEIEVIKALRPENLLLSYYYYKNINIQIWLNQLGYTPNVMLDSGAFTAYSCSKQIDLQKYIKYIKENQKNIDHFINLDVVGNADKSYINYLKMKKAGLNPIPVFHYKSDEAYLNKYVQQGEKYIALGGTVCIKNKYLIADWIRRLSFVYPTVEFHLLGSTSNAILDTGVFSCDSSAWIMKAAMGEPQYICGKTPEHKRARARYNMLQLIHKQKSKTNMVYEQTCMLI